MINTTHPDRWVNTNLESVALIPGAGRRPPPAVILQSRASFSFDLKQP